MILEEATNGEHEGEKASKVFINFRGGEMETTLFLKIRESKKFEVSWLKTPIVSKKRKKKKNTEKQKFDPIRAISEETFTDGKIELD